MIQYKRLIGLGLAAVMILSLTSCKKDKSVTYDPLTEEDNTVYEISICQDEGNDYYNNISLGFLDALNDLFGADHVHLTTKIASNDTTTDAICADYVKDNTQLIFANGPDSVSSAAAATQEIPIVGSGVMDYQHLLHLTAGIGNKWNNKTDSNVTGVSSEPDIAAQVSLIIETTPDLKSVGLLYTADDTDALYQLAKMERYLDQAGIPWKEYALSAGVSTSEAATTDEDAEGDDTSINTTTPVITKTKTVAASFAEGSNQDVEIFGGSNLIDGIISPNSAHAPLVSQFWTEDLSAENTEPLPEDASLEEIITYASNECSCLYITTGNHLSDQIDDIVAIATETGTRTVSGDGSLGESTLTSTYMDPYALGYAAGKKVYQVLVTGNQPGDIKISAPNVETVKLYNGELAKKFEMEFPKSFHEIEEFKESYVIGSSTTRITKDD